MDKNMNDDNPAKALYWSYACNHFFLDRDGALEQYQELGGGNRAKEEQWRYEFIQDAINRLSSDDLCPLHSLMNTHAHEAIPSLLEFNIYTDDYYKFWFAFTLSEVATTSGVNKKHSKLALKKAKSLWTELIENPQGITPDHKKDVDKFMLKSFDASTPEEYVHNYSLKMLKKIK
jgi:hypothetical protein